MSSTQKLTSDIPMSLFHRLQGVTGKAKGARYQRIADLIVR